MTHSVWRTAVGLLILLGLACSHGPEPPHGKLEVFVSILPLAGFVERIGGDYVNVHVLVQPGQDPHTFEPTPKDMVDLAKAKLYFTIGVPFEDRLVPQVRETHKNLTVVDAAAGIKKRPLEVSHFEQEAPGPDAHHEEKGLDPHVWLSPPLIRVLATNIADALCEADPAHAASYKSRLETFIRELEETDARVRAILEPYRGRSFYVFHPSFGYFADAYGLKQEAVELGGKSPAPKQLAELVQKARSEGVHVIFVQPQFAKEAAEAVAAAIDGSVIPLDDLAKDVLKNLETMAASVARAFQE